MLRISGPGSIATGARAFFSVGFRVKKRLSRVKKRKAFSLCHGGVVIKAACGAQSLWSVNRFLAWAPSPLNSHTVSWLKSERKGLGKAEKSRWCSGGAVVLEV